MPEIITNPARSILRLYHIVAGSLPFAKEKNCPFAKWAPLVTILDPTGRGSQGRDAIQMYYISMKPVLASKYPKSLEIFFVYLWGLVKYNDYSWLEITTNGFCSTL